MFNVSGTFRLPSILFAAVFLTKIELPRRRNFRAERRNDAEMMYKRYHRWQLVLTFSLTPIRVKKGEKSGCCSQQYHPIFSSIFFCFKKAAKKSPLIFLASSGFILPRVDC